MAARERRAMPKRKAPRKRQLPRAARKDEKGIPLTSDSRQPLTILPSDFAAAMQPPPGAPTEATRVASPERPTTQIPELNAIQLTPFAYQCIIEAITAAGDVQRKKMNPQGGPNLRYRIEIAAAFLTDVMEQAYEAALATSSEPRELVHLATNLVIRRAEEIYGQGSA
jgi:hypothetical protein